MTFESWEKKSWDHFLLWPFLAACAVVQRQNGECLA